MNNIIESLISIDTDKMFVLILAIFFTIEQLLENGSAIKKNSIHLFHSIILQAGYIILNILIASLFVFIFDWVAENNIGLLNQIELPYIIKIIVGIIAIDFVGTNTSSGTKTYILNFCERLEKLTLEENIIIFLTDNYLNQINFDTTKNKKIQYITKPNF